MLHRPLLLAALLAAGPLCMFFGASCAWAADPAEDGRVAEAESLIAKIDSYREEEKREELERALALAPKVHNQLKTDAVRRKLQKALGAVLGAEALGPTRSAAADALGRLNDPAGAARELKPFLPSVKVEASGPFPLRVIQATGLLACDASIATLVKLMEKAEDPNVSRYAIGALGKYGWSKRRVSILGDLADFLRRLRPGGTDPRKSRGGGQAARERYQFLQLSLVAALNELTGQKLANADAWLEAYQENKKSLAKLFTFER